MRDRSCPGGRVGDDDGDDVAVPYDRRGDDEPAVLLPGPHLLRIVAATPQQRLVERLPRPRPSGGTCQYQGAWAMGTSLAVEDAGVDAVHVVVAVEFAASRVARRSSVRRGRRR